MDERPKHALLNSLALCGAFAVVSVVAVPLWERRVPEERWRLEGGVVTLPSLEWALPFVLGALALCALLLCASRVHEAHSRSWAMLLGATAAGIGWGSVLGPGLGDAFSMPSYALAGCAGLALLPAAIFLVVRARRGKAETRLQWSRSVLAIGILLVLWLDATVAFAGIGRSDWWFWYVMLLVLLTLARLGVTPLGRESRRELGLGTLALWLWTALVAFVPWNRDKVVSMDLRGIEGQNLHAVRERMADHLVTVEGSGDGILAEGLTRGVDLASFPQAPSLYFRSLLGGCRVVLDEGIVARVDVNHD